MFFYKPKVLIEIQGGAVSSVSSNMEQDEIDLYIIDWDNINGGDKISKKPIAIDNPFTDVELVLKKMHTTKNNQLELFPKSIG